MNNVYHSFPFIFCLDSSHVHEVCSSQDTSCSQQTIRFAHQSSCYPEANSSSQLTGSEADASTVHEVIDLSQYNTPSMPPDSVELSGLQIYKADVQTVQPKEMITDTIVLFLLK